MPQKSLLGKIASQIANGGFLKKMEVNVISPFKVTASVNVQGETLKAFEKAAGHPDLLRYVQASMSLDQDEVAASFFESAVHKVHPDDYIALVKALEFNKAFDALEKSDLVNWVEKFYEPLSKKANAIDKNSLFIQFDRSGTFRDSVLNADAFTATKMYGNILSDTPDSQAVSMLKNSFTWAEKSNSDKNFREYTHEYNPRFIPALYR